MGAQRTDGKLHGRTIGYDCGDFIATVSREDFTAPIRNGGISTDIPARHRTGTLNGGALSRTFVEGADGRRSVSYRWIGNGHLVSLVIAADDRPIGDLTRYGAGAIDLITR